MDWPCFQSYDRWNPTSFCLPLVRLLLLFFLLFFYPPLPSLIFFFILFREHCPSFSIDWTLPNVRRVIAALLSGISIAILYSPTSLNVLFTYSWFLLPSPSRSSFRLFSVLSPMRKAKDQCKHLLFAWPLMNCSSVTKRPFTTKISTRIMLVLLYKSDRLQ